MRLEGRSTRAAFLAGVGAATAAIVFAVRHGGRAVAHPPGPRPSRYRLESDFASTGSHPGWGGRWQAILYDSRLRVEDGLAGFSVPPGLGGTAPDQPMPILLLDSGQADSEQLLVMSVSDETLRPGLLLRAGEPYRFVGVTIEADELVVADYVRGERRQAGRAGTARLEAGSLHRLRVRAAGDTIFARAWPDGDAEPDWQLAAAVEARRPGMAGVLVVHPTSLRASTLDVRRHLLVTDEKLRPTPPRATVLISGIPRRRRDGGHDLLLRVWSAYPARIRFEWSRRPDMKDAVRGPERTVAAAPYTSLEHVVMRPGAPCYWRVRLRSLTSPAETVSDLHEVPAPVAGKPIVLLAASCGKLFGAPANDGFRRLLEAAPHRPRALVFQGDIGYANSTDGGGYGRRADFFYDRFQRFLADPGFAQLRRGVPTGFTMDDHEYGPANNADRTTLDSWAIALWNRLHADPTSRDYFDFRIDDVHCLTLDGRRYCDPVTTPDTPAKTKLGFRQRAWLERTLQSSDAAMFVIFSADIFATRRDPVTGVLAPDCFIYGWPDEYRWAMALFTDMQLLGKRVVIVSGDAHSLRIHNHPDPRRRPAAARLRVTELICAGIRARSWSGAAPDDPTLDRSRYRLGVSGAGQVVIGAPDAPRRTVTLRAIAAQAGRPYDVWPPLVLPFAPPFPK